MSSHSNGICAVRDTASRNMDVDLTMQIWLASSISSAQHNMHSNMSLERLTKILSVVDVDTESHLREAPEESSGCVARRGRKAKGRGIKP